MQLSTAELNEIYYALSTISKNPNNLHDSITTQVLIERVITELEKRNNQTDIIELERA
jgi:hypothetical protein